MAILNDEVLNFQSGKERDNIENFINEGVYQVEKLKEDGWITNIMYDDEVQNYFQYCSIKFLIGK